MARRLLTTGFTIAKILAIRHKFRDKLLYISRASNFVISNFCSSASEIKMTG